MAFRIESLLSSDAKTVESLNKVNSSEETDVKEAGLDTESKLDRVTSGFDDLSSNGSTESPMNEHDEDDISQMPGKKSLFF